MKPDSFRTWLQSSFNKFKPDPYLMRGFEIDMRTMTDLSQVLPFSGEEEGESVESVQAVILGRLYRLHFIREVERNPYYDLIQYWLNAGDRELRQPRFQAHFDISADFVEMMLTQLGQGKAKKKQVESEVDQLVHARDDRESLSLIMRLDKCMSKENADRLLRLDMLAMAKLKFMQQHVRPTSEELRLQVGWQEPEAWWALTDVENLAEQIFWLSSLSKQEA